MKKAIGIDIGTTNTFIYVPKRGIIFNEPSVVAINSKTKKVVEVGYLAAKMLGRAPQDINVIKPFQNGVIADLQAANLFLKSIFKQQKLTNYAKHNQIFFSAPCLITPVEKHALIDLGKALTKEDVIITNQPVLAALGSKFDIDSPHGLMVVTLGGGCSDVAIISGGEVIVSKTCYFSGDRIDNAISRYIRNKHHLIIGEKTSEFIKMKIGSVEQLPENRLIEVSGRDIVSSLPHSIILSTTEIKGIITPLITEIIDNIVDCLELTPAEVASDIVENGIIISGGTALLSGLREYLEKNLNIPVQLAPDALLAVIKGLAKRIDNL